MTDPSRPTHDSWLELSAAYALGALQGTEAETFEVHLRECPTCQTEVRSLAPVITGLAFTLSPQQPPGRLREAVLRAVGIAARSQEVDRTAPPRDRLGSEAEAGVRASRGFWLLAAAAVLVITLLGAWTVRLQRRLGELQHQLLEAATRMRVAERQVADARQLASRAQEMTAILTAPDLLRFDMAGQPPAPRASGRALWSRSRGLVFTASELPATPSGKIYQMWVLTSGTPVSAGLLNPDEAGNVSIVLSTSPDLPTPVGMAVSLEPAGGAPAPTGAIYLASTQ